MKKIIAILGGTFDPVHLGHLHMAQQVYQQLPIEEIRFIPCKIPVLKSPAQFSPEQRLTLLQLALHDFPYCKIDERELQRATPSYTVLTLKEIRHEIGVEQSLAFILGSDAFADFSRWHEWETILSLAHLIIIPRMSYNFSDALEKQPPLKPRIIADPHYLIQQPAGAIFFLDCPQMTISSTEIRQCLAKLALAKKNTAVQHSYLSAEEKTTLAAYLPRSVIDGLDREQLQK
ncbi:MAG: nicotinate-nucleotide adenylyltransferase [Legionellales bacterium]|nr:nicotinate-nucleotide adenylyltransferase [Legionellales bacterium]